MGRYHLISFPLLATILLAAPTLAESPFADIHAANVRRLLISNGCPDCNLEGVELVGAHLIGADLRGANLSGADLSWVNLEGADLTKANLEGANLTGAFLTNASLAEADLDGANLSEAQLYFVDVADASMENINLAGATVVGTPISIGSGTDPGEGKPITNPEVDWQPNPPVKPQLPPEVILDVPEQIIPTL